MIQKPRGEEPDDHAAPSIANSPRLGEMLGEDDWFDKMSAEGRDHVRFDYMLRLQAFTERQKRAILAGESTGQPRPD